MKTFHLLVVTLLLCPAMQAQDAGNSTLPPLPSGPLLNRAPDFSRWTVVSRMAGSAQSPNAPSSGERSSGSSSLDGKAKPAKQLTVVKTGRIIYEQIIDLRGQKSEMWHTNGLQLLIPTSGSDPLVYPDFGGDDIYSSNYAVSDFAGLTWISEKTFAGLQKVKGRDCIYFKGEMSPLGAAERRELELQQSRSTLRSMMKSGTPVAPETNGKPSANPSDVKVLCRAWIDLETRLPLIAAFGNEVRDYEFGSPPSSALALPAALAKVAGDFQRRTQELARLPARP